MVNKKAVSLMISYVILIAIAVTMSITVFVWLRTIANIEPVKSCQEGTSIIISDYQCSTGKFSLTIKNNGRFSVHGFILTISDDVKREPIIRLIPFKANEITKEGYFIFNNSLKPGEIKEAIFSNKVQKANGNIEFIRNIKVQSFIIDKESNEKIVCEDVIRQNIENCKITRSIVDVITKDTVFLFGGGSIKILYLDDKIKTTNNKLNVNYTVSDSVKVDSCWYSNDTFKKNITLDNCKNITDVTWSIGQHNLTVWAKDISGNEAKDNISFTIVEFDEIPPTIKILHPNNNINTTNNKLNVNYTVSDDIKVDSCWYSNDTFKKNITLVNCRNITDVIWSLGQHDVTVWAKDTSGNEIKDSVSFTIVKVDEKLVCGPTAGLILSVPLEGNANDVSGNGLHGILVNSPANVSGCPVGNCFNFNGVNQTVRFPDYFVDPTGILKPETLSVSAWFKTAGQTPGTISPFIFGLNPAHKLSFEMFEPVRGSLNFLLNAPSGNSRVVSSPQTYFDDKWHHAVGTYDQQTVKLYVDGVLVKSQSYATNASIYYDSSIKRSAPYLASAHEYVNYFYKGSLDELKLYNRALSASEVITLVNCRNVTNVT